ncbi:MAG: hypothetical protein M3N03_01455 [Actinomycetota bacterium]|nr:hypothetical protein [Actinomycetota bacterium]
MVGDERFGRRWSVIRVFVAFENQYRIYREAISEVIGALRPQVEVTTTDLEDLEGELADLEPRVVISSRDKPANLPPGITWVYVSLDVGPTSQANLATLLDAIDRAEKPSPPREEGAVVPRGGALSKSAGNGP